MSIARSGQNGGIQPGVPALQTTIGYTPPLERISVADLPGADPTGVTSSSAAFQAGFVSNRTLVVPAGTWLLSSKVTGTGLSNFTLLLEHGATIKHAPALADALIAFNSCRRIRVTAEGVGTIDVSEAPNSTSGQANDALYFAGGTGDGDFEVDHIRFYSGTAHATGGGDSHIFFSGTNGNFHHNVFEAAWDIAIYLSGPGSGATGYHSAKVTDNHFINCAAACGSKRQLAGVIFANNTQQGGSFGFFTGEADSTLLPGYHNIVTGNRFVGLTGVAVALRRSNHDVVSNNQIVNTTNGAAGISLEGCTYCRVSGNVLYIDPAVYVSPDGQVGIRAYSWTLDATTYNSTDNTVEGNTIDGWWYAIREENTAQDRNHWLSNRVNGNTIAATTGLVGPASVLSGVTEFRTLSLADAVNRLEFRENVATGAPGLGAVGTDVSIGLLYRTKGAGTHTFTSDGSASAVQFVVARTASPENFLQVAAGAAGVSPTLSAQGAGTDLDITLSPKGTGNVRFGNLTASADVPVTGYITIKDASGTLRKLAVVA